MKGQTKKTISQKAEEIKLQQQQIEELLFGPEIEIQNKRSNIFFDRLFLEIQLRDGKSRISDVVMNEPREYEPVFHKVWFYGLADMLGVSRSVMDTYVKPKYVREFFIKYVYSRLSYKVYRELRSARKLAKAYDAKLFQFLKGEYYDLIETISIQIYEEMEGKSFDEFVISYSQKYKLPIQQSLTF